MQSNDLFNKETLKVKKNKFVIKLLSVLAVSSLAFNSLAQSVDIDVVNNDVYEKSIESFDPTLFLQRTQFVDYDFDGDGKADVAVRRPNTFFQYVLNSKDDSILREQFGRNVSDIPISGDFDGDGKADVAVRRPRDHFWYIKNSSGTDLISGNSDGITRFSFGRNNGDIPVPADYDGDGITDVAVRRPSNQFWYILNSTGIDKVSNNEDGITRIRFGVQEEDIPVVGDYDGDGKADLAVRRPGTQLWYIRNSSGVDGVTNNADGITRKRFGLQETDIAVPADYDGDGKADIAVRRPSNFTWYILNSSDGEIRRQVFGRQEADIPIAADYDGDGKTDVAVRRPSTQIQYILNSSDNEIQRILFGRDSGDIPIASPVTIRMNWASENEILSRSYGDEYFSKDRLFDFEFGVETGTEKSAEF